jgi:hypothetical protein
MPYRSRVGELSVKTLESAADRKSIAERISKLMSSDRRGWGKMSVEQMVCHLCDSYRGVLGEKALGSKSGLFERALMKWAALRLPMKWPHGVATMPEMEQGVGGTPPAEFEKDRMELLEVFTRFCTAAGTLRASHPIFGRMTPWEWQRWGYLHADHHLRQFGR